jgi:hypothetical protein
MLIQPYMSGMSFLCGLRAPVRSFPLYVAFPHSEYYSLIRLPIGIRRAFPFTVLLRLPAPKFPPST